MQISQLNSIAVRIAITIVLAIVLGIMLEIALASGLGNFDFRSGRAPDTGSSRVIVSRSSVLVVDPRRNAQMLSSKIATIVRILASSPEAERGDPLSR